MKIDKKHVCDWLNGAADRETAEAIEKDLRDMAGSEVVGWLSRLAETAEKFARLGDAAVDDPRIVDFSEGEDDSGASPSLIQEQAVSHELTESSSRPQSRPLNLEEERLFQTALKADIPTLFSAIGFFANRARVALAPTDRQQLRAVGEAWLADREGDLKQQIRQDSAIWTLLSSGGAEIVDVSETARQIVDLIVPVCGVIPATYVAVLLVKQKLVP